MLAVLQEGLGDEGGVEVAALQLRQQSVRVELPDLLQVAKDQVRPAEEGVQCTVYGTLYPSSAGRT